MSLPRQDSVAVGSFLHTYHSHWPATQVKRLIAILHQGAACFDPFPGSMAKGFPGKVVTVTEQQDTQKDFQSKMRAARARREGARQPRSVRVIVSAAESKTQHRGRLRKHLRRFIPAPRRATRAQEAWPAQAVPPSVQKVT